MIPLTLERRIEAMKVALDRNAVRLPGYPARAQYDGKKRDASCRQRPAIALGKAPGPIPR